MPNEFIDKPEDRPVVTRQQMLRRQIDEAIWLFLVREEPYVANLVAWAAVDVLRPLCKLAGKPTFRSRLDAAIRPEKLKEWRFYERQSYNFSKHADTDPEAVLERWHPDVAAMPIFFALTDYGVLFGIETVKMLTFKAWYLVEHPEILHDGDMKDKVAVLGKAMVGLVPGNLSPRTSAKEVLLLSEQYPEALKRGLDPKGIEF